MSTSYRRIDTTDPRRHDRVKPLVLPASWQDDSVDIYGFLLSSATMVSGMAMITRLAPLAFLGFIFALANFAHDKPLQAKKESARNATSPFMGLAFSLVSIVMITSQKLMGSLPLHLQMAAQKVPVKT